MHFFSNKSGRMLRNQAQRSMTAVGILLTLLFAQGGVSAASAESNAAQSLRSAISGSSDMVTISENIVLESTLTIPAGRSLSISGSGKLSGEASVNDLIVVESGASVTFAGSVELNGQKITGSIISTNGSVTVTGDVKITGADVKSTYIGSGITAQEAAATGAVEVLDGGSLTLKGGNITENVVRSDYCGTIYVGDGGSISIEDGAKIYGNKAYNNSDNYTLTRASAGVFMHGGATGTMIGGEIYQNTAMRGAAIMLYSVDAGKQAEFMLQGGDIHHNESYTNGELEASGAVHVEGNASLIMQESAAPDGKAVKPRIRSNIAHGVNIGEAKNNNGIADLTDLEMRSAVGGGICVIDPYFSNTAGIDKEFKTKFVMNGGEILNNKAVTGGGIYSFSNGAELNQGIISGNEACRLVPTIVTKTPYFDLTRNNLNEGIGGMGGGVYIEGNTDHYSIMKIHDAVIENNTAYFMGGGVWFCPTGLGDFKPLRGALIYGNHAEGYSELNKTPTNRNSGAGDDVLYGGCKISFGEAPLIPIAEKYPSLSLSDLSLGGYDAQWYMDGFVRSGVKSGTAGLLHNGTIHEKSITSWNLQQRYSTEDEDENTRISGMQNVYVYTDPLLHENNGQIPVNQEFGYALKCVMNEEDYEASKNMGRLIIKDNAATYGGGIGANGGVIIGEPGDPNMDVILEKKWEDNENQYGIRPAEIQAELYLNGKPYRTVTLSAENGWRAELGNLPLGDYTVIEKAPQAYSVSYTMRKLSTQTEEKIELLIINTLDSQAIQISEGLPKTGDSSALGLWYLLALVSAISAGKLKKRDRRA